MKASVYSFAEMNVCEIVTCIAYVKYSSDSYMCYPVWNKSTLLANPIVYKSLLLNKRGEVSLTKEMTAAEFHGLKG